MPVYSVPVTVTYLDTVRVRADSEEDAARIVLSSDFTFDQALGHDHDTDPLISLNRGEIEEEHGY